MGIPGILVVATYYLQAISAGGLVTGLLLLLKFLAKELVELTLDAASVVSLRIRFVAIGAGGRAAGDTAGKAARIGTSSVILFSAFVILFSAFVILFSAFVILFSACNAGPPQLITHSCIVAKLFSLPGGVLYEDKR